MRWYWQLLLSILCASTASVAYAQSHYEPNWGSLMTRPLPQWFDESKIGVFIHWSAAVRCTLSRLLKFLLTQPCV